MNRRRRQWLMLGVLTGVYGWGCWALADRYVHPNVRGEPLPPTEAIIQLPSSGTPAWITPGLASGNPDGDTVFVLVHGYGGDRAFWSGLFRRLQSEGYECIVPAMPAHDGSPYRQCGFGKTEAEVVTEAANWARSRFTDRQPQVVAVGVSLGGAAVWLASEKSPHLFDAVASEGTFAHLRPAIRTYLNSVLPFGSILLWPVPLLAAQRGNVSIDEIDIERAARAWKGRPALVIHTGADRFFDRTHAERLAKASGAVLWEVPDAPHASAQIYDLDGYVERLNRLIELSD